VTPHQSRPLGAVPRRSANTRDHQACPPDLLPPVQIGLAERIHKEFLQSFGHGLANYLEMPVAANFVELRQMPQAEFLASREGDCLMTLELEPFSGLAFLSLPTEFVSRVLSIVIGAPQPSSPPNRTSLTDIELHILQGFFDSLFGALQESWGIANAGFKVISIGSEPPDSGMAADISMIVIASAVQFDNAEASFRLAVPALLIRAAALESAASAPTRISAGHPSILEALRTAKLQVDAVLSGSTLRMTDLLAMEPGEILMLANPAGSSFDCVVNGRVKFRGELIHIGDRQALQIASRVLTGTRCEPG
jgi:flagellar motor switch protein FliM